MSFLSAMDEMRDHKVAPGENETMEFVRTGENLLDLFFKTIRGMSPEDLSAKYRSVIGEKSVQNLIDLFVLCFQTRDCRGGKGEKLIFVKLFVLLAEDFPDSTARLIPLIAQYGYYKDYWNILEEIGLLPNLTPNLEHLRNCILEYLVVRLKTDAALVERAGESNVEEVQLIREQVSLCAKYMPREGNAFCLKETNKECMRMFLCGLFPDSENGKRKESYRKMCAKICCFLDVVEQKMCSHSYSEIQFSRLPSVCTKKYRKAFLNETLKGPEPIGAEEGRTGNRFPLDLDRVECRTHFIEHIHSGQVKGGRLHPHELVNTILARDHPSAVPFSVVEKELLNAQWKSMRESLLKELEEAATPLTGGTSPSAATVLTESTSPSSSDRKVDLGKLVPLSDVSGSMNGTPMDVSIALGILISETTNEAFRNRVLTFESQPSWCSLPPEASIVEKVDILSKASWGNSTNLEAALDRIVEVCEANRLPPEAVPDLIIFSDMQFDQADNNNKLTQFEKIEKKFYDLGVKLVGSPYPVPRVIFWNLRSDTVGFPAEATTSNVQLLSGYSPSLLKAVLLGEPLEEESETSDEKGDVGSRAAREPVTPYETLRRVLDDKRYDDIRQVVTDSQELENFVTR